MSHKKQGYLLVDALFGFSLAAIVLLGTMLSYSQGMQATYRHILRSDIYHQAHVLLAQWERDGSTPVAHSGTLPSNLTYQLTIDTQQSGYNMTLYELTLQTTHPQNMEYAFTYTHTF